MYTNLSSVLFLFEVKEFAAQSAVFLAVLAEAVGDANDISTPGLRSVLT